MEANAAEDNYNLERFLKAQERNYAAALSEIRSGKKTSHWMWYVFPQVAGLGNSEYARLYAIRSRNEASAYLQHPILGPRLREICEALLESGENDALKVFGSPDNMKLRSSMTLFSSVTSEYHAVFKKVLAVFFEGVRDAKSLQILKDDPH